jgi:FlaA1/EpsC-like NDP-sugar epimerase
MPCDWSILQRSSGLFENAITKVNEDLNSIINNSSFLVIGGAGSIGSAVTKEIFKRGAKKLHVVDLSENYIVELVRDIRSSYGYTTQNFDVFALGLWFT